MNSSVAIQQILNIITEIDDYSLDSEYKLLFRDNLHKNDLQITKYTRNIVKNYQNSNNTNCGSYIYNLIVTLTIKKIIEILKIDIFNKIFGNTSIINLLFRYRNKINLFLLKYAGMRRNLIARITNTLCSKGNYMNKYGSIINDQNICLDHSLTMERFDNYIKRFIYNIKRLYKLKDTEIRNDIKIEFRIDIFFNLNHSGLYEIFTQEELSYITYNHFTLYNKLNSLKNNTSIKNNVSIKKIKINFNSNSNELLPEKKSRKINFNSNGLLPGINNRKINFSISGFKMMELNSISINMPLIICDINTKNTHIIEKEFKDKKKKSKIYITSIRTRNSEYNYNILVIVLYKLDKYFNQFKKEPNIGIKNNMKYLIILFYYNIILLMPFELGTASIAEMVLYSLWKCYIGTDITINDHVMIDIEALTLPFDIFCSNCLNNRNEIIDSINYTPYLI